MNIPTPGLFPTGDFKKDGYALFAKFIRTKDVDKMQESTNKGKLKVCISLNYLLYK